MHGYQAAHHWEKDCIYNGPYNQPKAEGGILNLSERITFPSYSYFLYLYVFGEYFFLPVICIFLI